VWTAEWKGGFASDVSGRGHALRADEPPQYGGEDSGPMPTELLIAALASCFCAAVAWSARRRKVELPDLEVEVRAVRAPGEPRHGAYEIAVHSSLAAEELAPLVELAKDACWVSNTLRHPPELRYRLGDGKE
jgi:putative redox protein